MLEQEFSYYISNKDLLIKQYLGRFLVIKDQEVVGDFDTEIDAYSFGVSNYELGTFLIQQCLPGEESYTQTFHSRVIFG